jgi:hypothetical protein
MSAITVVLSGLVFIGVVWLVLMVLLMVVLLWAALQPGARRRLDARGR